MSKPIFLVKLSSQMNQETCDKVNDGLSKKLTDWHVLVIGGNPPGPPEFAAYHIGNATDMEIEEFKKMALGIIDKA